MYKSQLEESKVSRALNSCILSETSNQTIEREIDNYTRLLEQDKRKYFRIQENRNEVLKQYSSKLKQLENLKSREEKTQMIRKKGEVKILERELNQCISSYNESLACNNRLRSEIDELRKEKKNQNEAFRTLMERVAQVDKSIAEKKAVAEAKKSSIESAKEGILQLRHTNEQDMKHYHEQVAAVKYNLEIMSNRCSQHRRNGNEINSETVDTLPLVKFRLRQLLNCNNERMKVIDNYKKVMQPIWNSFQKIKEESVVGDLEDITDTIIKQEQQNMFIYQYISRITKEIEEAEDGNAQLKAQIEKQKEENQKMAALLNCPSDSGRKQELSKMLMGKQIIIENFGSFLEHMRRSISLVIPSCLEETITTSNMEQYLAELENMIVKACRLEDKVNQSYKDEITNYSRTPPTVSEDIKEMREERLLEPDRLRNYAGDYWERRKNKTRGEE